MAEAQPLEEILTEAQEYFGDLSRKMLDHTGNNNFTSQQKKEQISEFYRKKMSSLSREDVPEAAEKIKEKANELNLPHETVAGFCIAEKLEYKSRLFISRDQKLLKTIRSEREKVQRIENSDMLKAFIRSNKDNLYNLKSQLNLYKSSAHGFNALKQLAEKFDLGEDPVNVAEELEDLATHRVNHLENIRDMVGSEPREAVKSLKEMTEEFREDSEDVSRKVVSIKRQQEERERKIEEYKID